MDRSRRFRPPLDLGALALLLAISAAVAGVGAAATVGGVRAWYPTLNKPGFTPPNWLFGPAWTLLYLLMAVAAWRVWRTRRQGPVGAALGLYAAQLVLNFAWSPIFFALHRIGLALADIAALAVLVGATAWAFWRRDRIAGVLMFPYLGWIAFAAALNAAIWRLN